ncbi:short-chain dehydrogenase/reductase SDR [Mycobacterium lentiflavum]|uniref:Short-chain dehydrogenase/reductase SDR n=1 Tax=Mycobacterium lentiflavum TaxID=141349 RepID=A0A0E4GZU5_MYCLN|nr:SDR family oxidoreductase [Mycobacterium lentiflavum]CQD17657.1 short-chain dehydrogenase/reductase SDR [Mycobacterium lentiflavum]
MNADQPQGRNVSPGTYDLTGTTVVVTGGNAGIGAALARGVGRAGAAVAIWARNDDRNEATVAALRAEGIEAWSVVCDVAVEPDVEHAMAATLQRFGRVDSLFANAGIAAATPYVETTLADWQRVMQTNLDGSFLTTRAAARHMIERGSGSIVVVSSMVSRYGAARQAAYAVTKSGLVGLGRTLAVELARYGIRVNILVPGWTITAMNEFLRADPKFMKAATARIPVRRWAADEDYLDVAPFLAHSGLTYHTGNEVVVDGGYSVF